MSDPVSPEALLARVARRDRAAFEELYRRTAPHLFGVAVRILGQRALAEEALQDAFVQVWQKAGEFRPERAQASTWMSSLVRYRALDALRRTGRETPLDSVPEAALPRITLDPQTEPALERCLGQLPAEPRTCIALAFVEGCSHPEVAQRVGKPLGTVKSWIRRGLAQLKDCLET
ncbi:MAG TPA: sigma-70 family RNA polymerase sigma factor [Candidatus Binatia bacterium]|nr:sigma-70 family RNA polymerase sigma factor [Candidatus Binatia bacterium]